MPGITFNRSAEQYATQKKRDRLEIGMHALRKSLKRFGS